MKNEEVNDKRYVDGVAVQLIKPTEEYKAEESKMCGAIEKFTKKLSPENKTLFYKLYEVIADCKDINAIDMYTEGFKFGLLMGLEIISD